MCRYIYIYIYTHMSIEGHPPQRQFISQPPDSSRTLRSGLRMRNLTSHQTIGGIVHCLSTSSAADLTDKWIGTSLDIQGQAALYFIIAAASHKRSKSFTALDLATGDNEVVSVIASNADYHTYKVWNNEPTVQAIQALFNSQSSYMSMNNIIVVFAKTDTVNTYGFASPYIISENQAPIVVISLYNLNQNK